MKIWRTLLETFFTIRFSNISRGWNFDMKNFSWFLGTFDDDSNFLQKSEFWTIGTKFAPIVDSSVFYTLEKFFDAPRSRSEVTNFKEKVWD